MGIKDNKYYIPTVDEFHIGFKFDFDDGREWVTDFVFNETHSLLEIAKDCKNKRIRVKKLSDDCIKSLGWRKHYTPDYIVCDGPSRIEYRIYIDTSSSNSALHTYYELTYNKQRDNWTIWHYAKNGIRRKTYVKASGVILRNKSELKRLMKQLNIEHETSSNIVRPSRS